MGDAAVVAVDWGTTSFRLWSLAADGAVLVERRSDQGMSRLAPADYAPALSAVLSDLAVPADTPVIVCGMAGAAQGWRNAPYLDLPANLDRLGAAAVAAPPSPQITPERDIRILPGLAQRNAATPDVMRGEETLLLGAALRDGVVCLPGTHAKWATLQAGAVTGFRTAMTGEAFELLAERSTLAHFASAAFAATAGGGGETASHPAFVTAVAESLAEPKALLAALFSVRAGPLLFGAEAASPARARLSGLLIGAEIAALAPGRGVTIKLIASGGLRAPYARAFEIAGLAFEELDAEAAARRGLLRAAESIWPDRFGSSSA